MITKTTLGKTTLGLAAALALAAPAAAGHHASSTAQPTIVETAASNGDFATLVAAVQAADLVDTLSSDGPFTVFAPTNAAFDALPAGTVGTLLRPENKGTLTKVLTYHVVAGNVSSSDLYNLIKAGDGHARIDTVAGETLIARFQNGRIVLTDGADRQVLVTGTDIATSNGTIHVLDRVLLPG